MKHKAGESKAKRRVRRVIEHNKKMITEHFHLDFDKFNKEHMKRLGEYYRRITAKFTDKEIEEARQIGHLIINCVKPEDGESHAEIAVMLWGDLTEEYLKDDMYVSKVNRLLYVLKMIMFEFAFNSTMEPQEAGRRTIPIIPCVRATKKLRVEGDDSKDFYKEYDESFEMIFNAAGSEYVYEALEEFDGFHKLKSNDYARVNVPHPLSKKEREYEIILKDLKGVGNRRIEEYLEELFPLVDRIEDRLSNLGGDGSESGKGR